jgi:hypothetical protein
VLFATLRKIQGMTEKPPHIQRKRHQVFFAAPDPAERWARPSGDEIREAMPLAGFTAARAGLSLGLGPTGDRAVRRWLAEVAPIPYAAWALLCHLAGLGIIWQEV